jgi:hypothetical protein
MARAPPRSCCRSQGAQNLSNRLYTVHPRRNDRFLRASGILRTIYRDVDFTEFHFTRHMLDHLRCLSEDRFDIVRTNCAWPGWPGCSASCRRRGAGAPAVARLPPAAGRGPCRCAGRRTHVRDLRHAGGRGTTGGVAERGRGSQSGQWYPRRNREPAAHAEAARPSCCQAPMHIGRPPSSVARWLRSDEKGPPGDAGRAILVVSVGQSAVRACRSAPARRRTGPRQGRNRRPGRSAPPRPC